MKHTTLRLALGALALGAAVDAHAQLAVFDVQSLIQLQQQVGYWQQQLDAMSSQVSTLRQQYASTTGARGMGALLPTSNAARNYLPASAVDIEAATTSPQAAASLLRSAYAAALAGQVGVSAPVAGHLSAADQQVLAARRSAVATRSSVMQAALATASARFGSLQGLIDAIDRTPDSKASMDLQGRIAAEQAMAANELAKLAAVSGWSDAAIASAQTKAREAALAAHGTFATRFHPTAN